MGKVKKTSRIIKVNNQNTNLIKLNIDLANKLIQELWVMLRW